MRFVLTLLVGLVLAVPTARSQTPESADAPAPMQGPWADSLTPHRRDARRLIRQGLFYLLLGMGRGSELDDPPWVQIERALARFERARRIMPADIDLAYYTAHALSQWERPAADGGTELRIDEAIAAWHRVRALDADYMPARVAFNLATLHARRLELDQAVAEYEAALERDIPSGTWLMGRSYLPTRLETFLASMYQAIDPATTHGNLAENLMLQGDLDGAVEHYQAGLSSARFPMDRSLLEWGLALALYRNGEADAAMASALRAIEGDPLAGNDEFRRLHRQWGFFSVLHHPNVFFEPAYEIHAYHALGHEAYATHPDADTRRRLHRALSSWRRFLAEGGTSSRFAGHARAQIERLEAVIADLGEEAPARRAPR